MVACIIIQSLHNYNIWKYKIPYNINFNSTFVVKIGDGVNSEDKTADNVIYTARSSPIEKVSLKDK